MKRAKDKQNYLREIFETVYLRDVIDRNHLKNADGLRELVRILASTMGRVPTCDEFQTLSRLPQA